MQFREWVTLLLSVGVTGIIAAFAFSQPSSGLFSHVLSEAQTGEQSLQKGEIVVEINPGHCKQFTFDNDSGRILPGPESCEHEYFDSQGHPVPAGTMRRMDAISKSFSGK